MTGYEWERMKDVLDALGVRRDSVPLYIGEPLGCLPPVTVEWLVAAIRLSRFLTSNGASVEQSEP